MDEIMAERRRSFIDRPRESLDRTSRNTKGDNSSKALLSVSQPSSQPEGEEQQQEQQKEEERELEEHVRERLLALRREGTSRSQAVKQTSTTFQLPKSLVYKMALTLQPWGQEK
jgi:predicted Holliday junction resolvase-like endonuclease